MQGYCAPVLKCRSSSMGPRGAKLAPSTSRKISLRLRRRDASPFETIYLTSGTSLAVLIPRIRTINVRLSQAEYLELERLCVARGARSLSDLVRDSMRNLAAAGNADNVLASTVNQHATQVKELEQKIERLSVEIASLRVDSPPRAGRRKKKARSPRILDDQGLRN